MKLLYIVVLIAVCQTGSGQVFDLSTGQKILSTGIDLISAKKLLANKYNFHLTGDTTYSGNVNWVFESKSENKYELILLYSTAFHQVDYIQFFDNINQAANYKQLIQKMGYSPQGVKYSNGGRIAMHGYQKGKLLFVIELGGEPGRCKMHFSKLED
ncbi:hypothetical protein [Sediminibacterium soli]|uniref:hypothetical protein n=1 Tax=Sediminibacterium soli TaxID=2698829 RepID=UPI00137AFBF2|nr:hypothetical protein [Sediminibacterium soli]NCI45039.1 hypothetical protein [Sediminibacterium soli]